MTSIKIRVEVTTEDDDHACCEFTTDSATANRLGNLFAYAYGAMESHLCIGGSAALDGMQCSARGALREEFIRLARVEYGQE